MKKLLYLLIFFTGACAAQTPRIYNLNFDTVKVTGVVKSNVVGNAATVTNGVYTNQSYTNPAWISSLAWAKLTGVPGLSGFTNDMNFVTASGNIATATKLYTARNINGVPFDGTQDIVISTTPLTANSPLNYSANILSIPQSSASQSGYLSASDYVRFNATAANSNAKVYFTSAMTVTLASYQTAYYPTYGNNPLLAIYTKQPDGTYAKDTVPAVITYVTAGDPTSGIASVSYTFPNATTGFIQIHQ